MLEIVFLGTSASVPTAGRSLPAMLVKSQGEHYLVDCGEGTQLRLMQAGESLKVSRVFLTHDHLDHWLGLGGLLFSISLLRMQPVPKVIIYGGDTTLERAEMLYGMIRSKDSAKTYVEVEFREVAPGPIFEDTHLTVEAFPADHRERPCFSYSFQSKGRNGVKVVFTGDTRYSDDLVKIAAGADCLVCEANFLSDKQDLAEKVGHLTAAQAGTIAARSGVKTLLLNHISRAYINVLGDVLSEAKSVFPQTIIPDDLDRFVINPDGVKHLQKT